MKKASLFVGYNFFVLVALLFLAEFATRVVKSEISIKGTTRSIIVDNLYNSTHGLRALSSGTTNGAAVSVDQYNFRKSSAKIDTSKASWLFIGDSVTFGMGIEDDSTFSAIVHSQADSLNILNPSASGNNINNYWDIFRCLVLGNRHNLKISRVSLFWCLNDVYTNVPDFAIPGGQVRYFFSDFITFIRIHSRLYHFVKTLAFDRPKSYFLFDNSFYDIENSEFQNAIKTIHQINESCSDRKIAFDIVLLPYEYQLREGDFTAQNLMQETLRNKINIQDPFQSKRNKVCNSKAYFLYGDGIHFSKFAHSYIAEFLIDYFTKV